MISCGYMNTLKPLPVTTSWVGLSFSADFVRENELRSFPYVYLDWDKSAEHITIRLSKHNSPLSDRKLQITKRGKATIRDTGFVSAVVGEDYWYDFVLYKTYLPLHLSAPKNEKRYRIYAREGRFPWAK